MYNLQCTVYSVQFTVCSVHCTEHIFDYLAYSAVYGVQCSRDPESWSVNCSRPPLMVTGRLHSTGSWYWLLVLVCSNMQFCGLEWHDVLWSSVTCSYVVSVKYSVRVYTDMQNLGLHCSVEVYSDMQCLGLQWHAVVRSTVMSIVVVYSDVKCCGLQ